MNFVVSWQRSIPKVPMLGNACADATSPATIYFQLFLAFFADSTDAARKMPRDIVDFASAARAS
jgi:hypothetical protein